MTKNYLILVLTASVLTSCATIFGGNKYYANVQVPNHPNAKIEFDGKLKGTGEATFKVKRNEANNFSVTIKENDCETETKVFSKRKFRGWAFAGSLVGWTGFYQGIPLPWGIIVDAGTGAWWKPDIHENGVTKENFNNYTYTINYTGCSNNQGNGKTVKKQSPTTSKADRLRELKLLLDEKIITEEDYEIEKKKILNE